MVYFEQVNLSWVTSRLTDTEKYLKLLLLFPHVICQYVNVSKYKFGFQKFTKETSLRKIVINFSRVMKY